MPDLESPRKPITSYQFDPGEILAQKYEVVQHVGSGWDGELYLLSERDTGIERTAKFFFPHRNPRNRVANYYARKLHRLRHCNILMQYHTQESIRYRGVPVTFLVSDFVHGELLSDFLDQQSGQRLAAFEGLHLLHALAKGLEPVHAAGEYHGQLHIDNVIVKRSGLGYRVKLLDLSQLGANRPELIREDVCDLIRMFYDAIGGAKHYGRQPQAVKNIVCGLKRSLIVDRYRTAGHLRHHLELMSW